VIGYDLEVADVKMMEDVDNEEGGELEYDEDDSYGPDDNPEYGDPSYLNMPASTSASYFQTPPGLHFGASNYQSFVFIFYFYSFSKISSFITSPNKTWLSQFLSLNVVLSWLCKVRS